MFWSQHRQLFDIGGKYQVLRFLEDKVLKKESCHLPDAGHGHVATDAIVRPSGEAKVFWSVLFPSPPAG